MTDEQQQLLLLGDATSAEMSPVADWLNLHFRGEQTERLPDVSAVEQLVTTQNWYPDLVVVCQNWPDEFSDADIGRLISLFPTQRLVCCFGVWCESDGRNRSIWPPAVRIPARCATTRLEHELAVLQGDSQPLPLTASRDEIFEYDCSSDVVPLKSNLPVSVVSPDYELRRWLEDLCQAADCRVLKSAEIDAAVAVLWDTDPWNESTANRLRDFCRRNLHIAVIALAGFAHPEEIAAIKASGAVTVVPKLTSQSEILNALQVAVSFKQKLSA